MALTADHLIVIGRGKLIAAASVVDFVARRLAVKVVSSARPTLAGCAVPAPAEAVRDAERRRARSDAADDRDSRRTAAAAGITLDELTPQQASLEEAFMEMTRDEMTFGAEVEEAVA